MTFLGKSLKNITSEPGTTLNGFYSRTLNKNWETVDFRCKVDLRKVFIFSMWYSRLGIHWICFSFLMHVMIFLQWFQFNSRFTESWFNSRRGKCPIFSQFLTSVTFSSTTIPCLTQHTETIHNILFTAQTLVHKLFSVLVLLTLLFIGW